MLALDDELLALEWGVLALDVVEPEELAVLFLELVTEHSLLEVSSLHNWDQLILAYFEFCQSGSRQKLVGLVTRKELKVLNHAYLVRPNPGEVVVELADLLNYGQVFLGASDQLLSR